jgi:hypothetical protein
MGHDRQFWLLFPVLVLHPVQGLLAAVLPLAFLILTSAAVGRALPASTASLEAVDCPQPCWQGIRPGAMTEAEVLALLEQGALAVPGTVVNKTPESFHLTSALEWQSRSLPVYDVQMRFSSGRLVRMVLFPRDMLLLEDVFSAFGPPTHAPLCQVNSFSPVGSYVTLYFFGGAVEVQAARLWETLPSSGYPLFSSPGRYHTVDWQVSPAMRVIRITYHADVLDIVNLGPLAAPWRGFGSVGGRIASCQ